MAALLSEVLDAQQAGHLDPSTCGSVHYLRKLLAVLRQDASGSAQLPEPLTRREREALALVAAGKSNAEIARELEVGVNTVKTHLKSVYAKLGIHSRD